MAPLHLVSPSFMCEHRLTFCCDGCVNKSLPCESKLFVVAFRLLHLHLFTIKNDQRNKPYSVHFSAPSLKINKQKQTDTVLTHM